MRIVIVGGALVLAVLGVVPMPWAVPLVVGAAIVDAAESFLFLRWSRRRRAAVGAETLPGALGVVVRPCRPAGQIRVQGELWQARCDQGADEGERVRVRVVDGLTLVVDRA